MGDCLSCCFHKYWTGPSEILLKHYDIALWQNSLAFTKLPQHCMALFSAILRPKGHHMRSQRSLPQSPLPDYLEPNLRILFVGINPGIRSATLGHHYAGHSNRFWKLLFEAKLVPERLTYRDDSRLPKWGIGLTNLVARATAGVESLTAADYEAGRLVLLRKVRRYRPRVVALLGLTLYPILFPMEAKQTPMTLGLQSVALHQSSVALLPNPSGRNAFYSFETMLTAFCQLSAT
jgi:TDG/mug DNA glycosylase family protein